MTHLKPGRGTDCGDISEAQPRRQAGRAAQLFLLGFDPRTCGVGPARGPARTGTYCKYHQRNQVIYYYRYGGSIL